MAIIQFGPSVTGIRGTIGGITFSGNRTSSYAKQHAVPPASTTPKQSRSRSLMVANSVLWAPLLPAVKSAWNAFALSPNELDYDPWGIQRFLSGFQWFARAQQRRATISLVNPGPVPSGSAQTAITGLTINMQSGPGGTSWLTYDDNQFLAGQAIIPYLSLAPTAGAADSFRNWKLILPTISPPNGGFDIHAAWRAAFGDIPPGWQAFVLAYKQAPAGNRSMGASANCVIT